MAKEGFGIILMTMVFASILSAGASISNVQALAVTASIVWIFFLPVVNKIGADEAGAACDQ